MADLTIANAATLTGAQTASGDLFPLVDVSAAAGSQGSKITRDELGSAVLLSAALIAALAAKSDRAGAAFTGAVSITPAANASALTLTGQSLTGSNAQSALDISGTWNTTGAPTALKVNITNTASGSAANLLDLCVGGSSLAKVTKAGYLSAVRVGPDSTGTRYFYETGGSTYFYGGIYDVLQLSTGGIGIKNSGAPLYFENGVNITFRTTTGTKIGTATTEKMAFWNATPVAQPAHIADPTGGATVDAEARTAINAILAWQATLGLTAAS